LNKKIYIVYLMDINEIFKTILNSTFSIAYPVAFLGSILYSMKICMTVDIFTMLFNKPTIIFLNIYIAICSYIAFATFFKIKIEVNNFIIQFEKIFISYGKYNPDYIIYPGQTEVSLIGF